MALFSERYGYTKPSEALIREAMPEEMENAICSCYDLLWEMLRNFDSFGSYNEYYKNLELYFWTKFLNRRRNDYNGYSAVVTSIIKDPEFPWYKRLDVVEITLKWLISKETDDERLHSVAKKFALLINHEFERLNYAYRFVDQEIVELTSEEEINAIETCLAASTSNVKMHLSSALDLLAKKPIGDYRNSIKESISAVEAVCREMTGKKSLGDALDELTKAGVEIPKVLKLGFEKLYGYTNNKDTGIRHALMDNDGAYLPSSAESIFMMVSCSAFINYLYAKKAQ